jgi:glycosidase
LPVSADYQQNNVESQQQDPESMLSLYRALLTLRRTRPALSMGSFLPLEPAPSVLGYLRTHGQSRDAVLLNLSSAPQRVALPSAVERAMVVLSTHPARAGRRFGSDLLPDEAVVLAVSE